MISSMHHCSIPENPVVDPDEVTQGSADLRSGQGNHFRLCIATVGFSFDSMNMSTCSPAWYLCHLGDALPEFRRRGFLQWQVLLQHLDLYRSDSERAMKFKVVVVGHGSWPLLRVEGLTLAPTPGTNFVLMTLRACIYCGYHGLNFNYGFIMINKIKEQSNGLREDCPVRSLQIVWRLCFTTSIKPLNASKA